MYSEPELQRPVPQAERQSIAEYLKAVAFPENRHCVKIMQAITMGLYRVSQHPSKDTLEWADGIVLAGCKALRASLAPPSRHTLELEGG